MIIKLDYYEFSEALSQYLERRNILGDTSSSYVEISSEITKQIRQPKKHKNGRLVKNKHGFIEYETVGEEKQSFHFDDDSHIEIYILD